MYEGVEEEKEEQEQIKVCNNLRIGGSVFIAFSRGGVYDKSFIILFDRICCTF